MTDAAEVAEEFFVIRSDVPVLKDNRVKKFLFDQMQVGDSILVPNHSRASANSSVAACKRRNPSWTYTGRTERLGNGKFGYRIWRMT